MRVFTFEYCQSALSSVRIETPASAETPRKNRVYSIHTGKSMAGGFVTPSDHNALTSTIGYRPTGLSSTPRSSGTGRGSGTPAGVRRER